MSRARGRAQPESRAVGIPFAENDMPAQASSIVETRLRRLRAARRTIKDLPDKEARMMHRLLDAKRAGKDCTDLAIGLAALHST